MADTPAQTPAAPHPPRQAQKPDRKRSRPHHRHVKASHAKGHLIRKSLHPVG